MEKVKVVIISRPEIHPGLSCTSRLEGFDLAEEFDGAEVGESVVATYGEMTEVELDALPEFEGW
jgi:hypothetical protein